MMLGIALFLLLNMSQKHCTISMGSNLAQEMHKSRIEKSLIFEQNVFCVKLLCIIKLKRVTYDP